MLLAFTLVLIVLILGIVVNISSLFGPFFENLANINDYNSAYYSAISSIERGLLVTKYKEPGFEGSGGFLGVENYGPKSDYILSGFGRTNLPNNGMFWEIKSRTNSIPSSGDGNVENQLSASDSNNYNILGPNRTETFILSYDNTSNPLNYYTGTESSDIEKFDGTIAGNFRLPPKIQSGFSDGASSELLCDRTQSSFCDLDGDDLYNDIVVNRFLEGKHNLGSFTIFPTQKINHSVNPKTIISNLDNSIRKNIINNYSNVNQLNFDTTTTFSPLENIGFGQSISSHNIITENSDSLFLADSGFYDIITSQSINNLKLKISLADLLYTRNEKIYPFLEYKFEFSNQVADRFYTIIGNGRVGAYNIQIQVKKPSSKDSVISEFNVVF